MIHAKTLITSVLLIISQSMYSSNWMSRLPDNQYVATVSIPGAHDAATGSGWATGSELGKTYSTTQDLTISEMWNIGIRAFDFRPSLYDGYMNIKHGITATNLRFDDVMYQLRDSLANNPSEFVILHLLHASDGDNVDDDYGTRLHQLFDSEDLKDYLAPFKYNLTVGELRGKILILSRDSYTNPIGGVFQNWTGSADWNSQQNGRITGKNGSGSCIMQDYSETWQEGAMETKLSAMTKLLDYSVWHKTDSPSDIKWIFNFASAYSKVMSLFGYNISLSSGYRDNASHTNPLIIDYLSKHSGPTGIVMMDYVGVSASDGYAVRGDEAVKIIIENNFKAHTNTYIQQATTWNGISPGVPSIADYNNNNTMDIYYGGILPSDSVNGYLYTQSANGKYSVEVSTLSNISNAHGLPPTMSGLSKWFDYNNDGFLDLLLTTRGNMLYDVNDQTWIYQNGGSDHGYLFEKDNNMMLLNGNSSKNPLFNNSSVSFADYDQDGYVDIVQQNITSEGYENVVYHNDNGLTFTKVCDLEKLAYGSVIFGDLNNDGFPDIIQSGCKENNTEGVLLIYKNNGNGTFSLMDISHNNLYGIYDSDICLSDLNGDRLLDIIACGKGNTSQIYLYKNEGNYIFSLFENHGVTGPINPSVKAFDINYDGLTDLMLTGNYDNQSKIETRFFLQKSNGTYELMTGAGIQAQKDGAVAIGDLSKRNTIDLFSISSEGALIYHLFEEPTKKPSRPTGLKASVDGRSITICWEEAKETGLDSLKLSYNIYLKDNDSGSVFCLIPANISTGRLRTMQDMQNAVRGNHFTITPPTGRNFFIGVQTIDPSFVTSTFTRISVTIDEPIKGDVNEDGVVNINDVVATVNHMAGAFTWRYADVNGDTLVDINDIVSIINIMSHI